MDDQGTQKVSYFVWTVALGIILTIDNFRKRYLLIVD